MNYLSYLEFGKKRMPLHLQTEAAECGLACLSMLASWHGHRIDLATLRSRCGFSLKGASLAQLVNCADMLQLASRAVRADLDELHELSVPCILHWDMNHFVVLVRVHGKTCEVHDPAIGARHLTIRDVGQHFTGVALELRPTAQFVQKKDERQLSLHALLGKVVGLWQALGLIFVMAIALELFALAGPIFNQWVVDEVLATGDRSLLNVLAIGFGLMLVIQTCISLARGWTVLYLSTHLNLQWVTNVFTHLLHLPVNWFEKRHLGDVVSRFESISTIQNTITHGFIEAILDGVMAFATLAVLFAYSPKMALVVLSAVLLYATLRVIVFRPLREANEEALVLQAKERSCFIETIRGVQAIKLFGRELDRRGRWLNLMVDATNRDIRTEKFMLWFGIASTAILGAEHLVVFWLGAGMVMDGAFTVGMLVSFSAYGVQFSTRASALVNKYFEVRMLSLHAERLADVVLEPPEEAHAAASLPAGLSPRIELIGVGFRYAESEPWVIRDLHLTIEPGESIALVGPSGCGKTTLAKLILGILPATEGEIKYGGVAIQQLGLAAYRQAVAAVMQEDSLLAGSLAENICFFDPHAEQDRIEACAQLAAIRDDIVAMPMGFHTLAGDMGTTLSGGQKQRVLLARALYKDPKVLVLDEATSHLDVEREREVNNALSALSMTRICIAHRPETIAMSGRVIHMPDVRAFERRQVKLH